MKIPFTKAEYRVLLDLAYLGEWMLSAHDQGDDPAKNKYRDVVQKIYSYAKDLGCESLVEGDRDSGMIFPNREYEDSGIREIVDAYDNDTFWDEITNRLVDRDIAVQAPHLAGQFPRPEEYWTLTGALGQRYAEEFTTHGLERVTVGDMGPGTGRAPPHRVDFDERYLWD